MSTVRGSQRQLNAHSKRQFLAIFNSSQKHGLLGALPYYSRPVQHSRLLQWVDLIFSKDHDMMLMSECPPNRLDSHVPSSSSVKSAVKINLRQILNSASLGFRFPVFKVAKIKFFARWIILTNWSMVRRGGSFSARSRDSGCLYCFRCRSGFLFLLRNVRASCEFIH